MFTCNVYQYSPYLTHVIRSLVFIIAMILIMTLTVPMRMIRLMTHYDDKHQLEHEQQQEQ
jgi:hypothetical protein